MFARQMVLKVSVALISRSSAGLTPPEEPNQLKGLSLSPMLPHPANAAMAAHINAVSWPRPRKMTREFTLELSRKEPCR